MSNQGWQQTLTASSASGTQILNSATQASIIPTNNKIVLGAGNLSDPGKTLKITAQGQVSCVVTTPGTLLFQVLFGAIGVFSPAAFNLNIVAKTNVTWWLEILLQTRTVGSGTTATIMGVGNFTSEAVVGSAANTTATVMLPASAPAAGSGFDSTAAQIVDLQAKFSVATATTALTCTHYKLESLN